MSDVLYYTEEIFDGSKVSLQLREANRTYWFFIFLFFSEMMYETKGIDGSDLMRDGYFMGYANVDSSSGRVTYPCPKCSSTFNRIDNRNYHLKNLCGTGRRYGCPYCDHTATQVSNARVHIRRKHQGVPVYTVDLLKNGAHTSWTVNHWPMLFWEMYTGSQLINFNTIILFSLICL